MAQEKKKQTALLAGVTDSAGAEAALRGAGYERSQAVQQAEQALAEHQAKQPGEYVPAYQGQIERLLEQITTREPFAYDFNADPLYQAYKDQYTHQGRLAMQDAVAAAQGATGGYGSSYGASAGSQAYQGYLNQLNAQLPELYGAALDTYTAGGEAMQQALGALTDQEKAGRDAYEDQVADYYTGLNRYAALAQEAYDQDYGEYADMLAALTDMRDYYAGQEQQKVKNQQSQNEYELALEKYQESVRQWQAQQAAAQEKWQAQLAQDQAQFDAQLAYKAAQAAKSGARSSAGGTAAKTTDKQKAGWVQAQQQSSRKNRRK